MPPNPKPIAFTCADRAYRRTQISQLGGVVVLEITGDDASLPDAKTRLAIYKDIAKLHHENLIIFVDPQRTRSLWYWVKRDGTKLYPRDHFFLRGQPGDLFLGKLAAMVVDITELDAAGNIPVTEVAGRLKAALDVERVTKKFFTEFDAERLEFTELITGIPDERDHRWYASVLLNRLMFIYFLQRKFFLNHGDDRYLQNKLAEMQKQGRDCYYEKFLKVLFFEGFAKPEEKRSAAARQLLGNIKYLNGGLFLPHPIELRHPRIAVPDQAFANLFALFERYSWNLNDTPGGADNEINPDVLGYIFEKYINQKAFGAYYTRPEITEYLCERTIHRLVLDAVNTPGIPGVLPARRFDSVGDLLLNLDAPLCKKLLHDVLPNLKLLDPACGSAAFLVAAMKTLINLYAAVIGKIKFLNDRALTQWLADIEKKHPSVNYYIKKTIITENLFGVDIMEEATEIAKLRLFLALVAAANSVDDLEPLPNIEFNIMAGNSLIGLMHVDDQAFEDRTADLFRKSYRQILAEKNRLIESYRHATTYAEDLQALRDNITAFKQNATAALNDLLLAEFSNLGIKFEQAAWDDKKNAESKPVKRSLHPADIAALKPFHWGFEFDEIINQRGGFDAIITNPPWEVFQTDEKEFLQEFDETIRKKKIDIKEWEKRFDKLMEDKAIRQAWLEYESKFPHVSSWFKKGSQYSCLRTGKINLYMAFTEQCYNLLRQGGYCGIVIPSGIYTDLGAKQLRELLFTKTNVTGLFCFENRKEIFEGVHRSFKFLVLTFEKGGVTESFPAAFMRHDVAELERFPQEGAIPIAVDLVRRLSPDSLSVMEFKTPLDVQIAEKMLQFPLLGEELPGKWNLRLTQEFNMTTDAHLFKTEPAKGRLPLYEGKMIWQFDHRLAPPRYWVDEKQGRQALLGREADTGQPLDYQAYRLGFRDVAASTNERTMICGVVPANVFAGNTLITSQLPHKAGELVVICAVLNSFVFDSMIRQKITNHCNMFYVYQMPVPRLTEGDGAFWPIVERAARLICTTPEFDDLAKEIFGRDGPPGRPSASSSARPAVAPYHQQYGATDPAARAKLRAELDGLIAHLYGLTEQEFAYILTTFPLVAQSVKDAALQAYRYVARGLIP